jgi:hypothetical protein
VGVGSVEHAEEERGSRDGIGKVASYAQEVGVSRPAVCSLLLSQACLHLLAHMAPRQNPLSSRQPVWGDLRVEVS